MTENNDGRCPMNHKNKDRSETILIVEDDRGLSELMGIRLEEVGVPLIHAFSAAEAMTAIASNPPLLMLLDLSLPDMPGEKLLESLPVVPPYIITTGHGDERVAVAMMIKGARDYLNKDSGFLNHLGATVRQVLSQIRMEKRLVTAESSLETMNAWLNAAMENSPVGVMLVDEADWRIRFANRAVAELHLISLEELLALKQPRFFSPKPRWELLETNGAPIPWVEWPLSRAIRDKSDVKNKELRIRRTDGSERWALVSASPVFDRSGVLMGGVVMMMDITERRKLEVQIQQTQKLESLGILAGGIAHDFNNLLMAIMGHADLALTQLSAVSPARENVRHILTASRRAADLTRQMLAYSGKGKFLIEPISLQEVIEEMSHLLEVSIPKKTHIKYSFADNLPAIDGDPSQVRQIVMNLITNAAEAIADRSGVISLSTGAVDCDQIYLQSTFLTDPLPDGLYVYLEVADTGCGMTRDIMERIFDPFFTTKFMGRGLGMAAVLGIVRGHKGSIKIYSEVGKGTSFKVLFPASRTKSVHNGTQVSNHDGWRGSGAVLLVDDEETVRAVGKRMLEQMGFFVFQAENGREALRVFGQFQSKIKLVILDLIMPTMEGEEAYRELRRIQPDVRVVLSSGYNEQDVRQRFIGKGLAGFIQKPYVGDALKEIIRGILDKPESP